MRHVALLLAITGAAWADGKVFSRAAPVVEMPDQRAILWFADGRERLAIDTSFRGEGDEFAWVVPLPSPPEVRAVSPGTFATVQALLAAEVLPPRRPTWPIAAILLVSILLISLVPWRWLRLLLLLVLLVGVLGSIAMPLGARAGFEAVTVHGRGAVGSYDVATVSAESPGDLLGWLDANGFRVAPDAREAVAAYVAEGWTFAAARLRSAARPHPLCFEFETPEATYPLRLTGTAGGPLELDLYVFGSRQATADRLHGIHCAEVSVPTGTDQPVFRGPPPWARFPLAHEGLREIAGRSTVVTKLSGTLAPDDMATDLRLGWKDFEAFHPVLVTREVALLRGIDSAAWAAVIAFFVLLAVAALVGGPAFGPGRRAPWWVWAGTAAAFVVAGAAQRPWHYDLEERHVGEWIGGEEIRMIHEEIAAEVGDRGDAEPIRALATRRWAGVVNPYTGAAVREEDSPGNYLVGTKDGRPAYLWFDARGARFPRDATGR